MLRVNRMMFDFLFVLVLKGSVSRVMYKMKGNVNNGGDCVMNIVLTTHTARLSSSSFPVKECELILFYRAILIMQWLKAVLTQHTAYLSSVSARLCLSVCVLAYETSRLLIFPLNVLFSAPGHGVSAGAALPHDREPGEAVPAADETPRQALPAHDAGTSPCFHTRLR